MNEVWNETERRYIKDNAGNMKDEEIALRLSKFTGRHVSINAVRKQRQLLGIKKAHGRGKCQVLPKPTAPDVVVAVPQTEKL